MFGLIEIIDLFSTGRAVSPDLLTHSGTATDTVAGDFDIAGGDDHVLLIA